MVFNNNLDKSNHRRQNCHYVIKISSNSNHIIIPAISTLGIMTNFNNYYLSCMVSKMTQENSWNSVALSILTQVVANHTTHFMRLLIAMMNNSIKMKTRGLVTLKKNWTESDREGLRRRDPKDSIFKLFIPQTTHECSLVQTNPNQAKAS